MGGSFILIYTDLVNERAQLESRLKSIQVELNSLKLEVSGLKELLSNSTVAYSNVTDLTAAWIYNLTKYSVVSITVKVMTPFGVSRAEGTGFVYDKEGHIITNNHVVENVAENNGIIRVAFLDGTIVEAELVGRDPYSDLAVLRVDLTPEKLHPLTLGNSSKLKVGEPVYAVGNPFGLSGSITQGIISQLGRMLQVKGGYSIIDVIQIDAAINPGNSGGPLLNRFGEVIGVNTAIYTYTGTFSGVGFAVPSNLVQRVVPALIANGTYKHPWIGIAGLDVTPEIAQALGLKEVKGFLITSVMPDSPAEKAGLRGCNRTVTVEGEEVPVGGDVIVAVDGRPVDRMNDLLVYLERYRKVGDKITLTILRGNEKLDKELVLGERPP